MNSHTLADAIVRAKAKVAGAVYEAEILGITTQHGAFVNYVGWSQSGELFNYRVRADFGTVADFGVLFDHGVRSDTQVGAEPGPRADDRCRVDTHLRTILACEGRVTCESCRLVFCAKKDVVRIGLPFLGSYRILGLPP